MKKIILCFLLLLPFAMKAQQNSLLSAQVVSADSFDAKDKEVKLQGSWKFQEGDNILWSSPAFNDSVWKFSATTFDDKELQQMIHRGYKGLGWFRKEIYPDTSLIGRSLALNIENDGAIAVYLDGKLLHQSGKFKSSGKSVYINPGRYPILFIFKDTGRHLIAVKYENYDMLDKSNWYASGEGGGFQVFLKPAKEAIEDYHTKTMYGSIVFFGGACLFGTLAFIHFMLFFFYKRATSNFYFGLFNCSIGFLFLAIYTGLLASKMHYQAISMYVVIWSIILAAYSLSAFVNNLFSKKKWSHYIVILCCIVIAVLFILKNDKTFPVTIFLTVFTSVEVIILIILAMIRKIPGSKILGTGILCFFGLIASAFIPLAFLDASFELRGIVGIIVLAFLVAAVFSIPASISFYLAWSFSSVYKRLGKQLEHVEQLSQKTLQQEQEKQQLLENRKEELEKEVSQRTTEVMHQKEQIERQHEALKTEKQKSDDLLLNILPAEVAQELKEKGEANARLFDNVSVLFTDFVNFTQISETLSPQDLVAELHSCFRAFDEIIERNNMEKIKTIGDAYLAVSGMPVYNDQHAKNAVKAGLEIAAYIKNRTNGQGFEIRVGIHSGPLVAGIVGVKKFAYDIWGDTVNTASRMESSSEPGRVNISENTYFLVKDDFRFAHRGKIDAKHKGAINMYFVEGDIDGTMDT